LWYEGKERRERGGDFNVEKGEGLFLPWISFPLSFPFFLRDFHRKKEYKI
jgi:hypothetical protein